MCIFVPRMSSMLPKDLLSEILKDRTFLSGDLVPSK